VNPVPQMRLPTMAEIGRGQLRAKRALETDKRAVTKTGFDPSSPTGREFIGDPILVDGVRLQRLRKHNLYVTLKQKQVWVPDVDDLRLRITVISHFDMAGHVGTEAMYNMIKKKFFWPGMRDLIAEVKAICIHCAGRGKVRERRPLGEFKHCTRPFEGIHADFVSLENVDEDDARLHGDDWVGKYILVVRDDFSGFTKLYAVPAADSRSAVDALLDWCSLFGTPVWLRTDGGTHLKHGFMKELNARWTASHYISTAYASFSNGFVERTISTMLQTMRSLLHEQRLDMADWRQLVAVVQHRLNHTPSRVLNKRTAFEVATGLESQTMLALIPVALRGDDPVKRATTIQELSATQMRLVDEHVALLQEYLWRWHLDISKKQVELRKQGQDRHAKARGLDKRPPRPLEIGDYVLHLEQGGKVRNKLQYYWRGPKQVVRKNGEHRFAVVDLVTLKEQEVHDVDLRFYLDKLRGNKVGRQKLKDMHKYQETLYIPDRVVGHTTLPNGLIMFSVSWADSDVVTAEPLHRFYADVPNKVNEYIDGLEDSQQQQVLRQAIADSKTA
jgi:hypothetical protein